MNAVSLFLPLTTGAGGARRKCRKNSSNASGISVLHSFMLSYKSPSPLLLHLCLILSASHTETEVCIWFLSVHRPVPLSNELSLPVTSLAFLFFSSHTLRLLLIRHSSPRMESQELPLTLAELESRVGVFSPPFLLPLCLLRFRQSGVGTCMENKKRKTERLIREEGETQH